MKNSLFLVLTIFALSPGCSKGENGEERYSARPSKVGIDSPAPDILLRNLNGSIVTLAEFRGKVVLLNFWNMKCRDCIDSMPSLEGLNQRFNGRGLVVLSINADNLEYIKPEKIANFIKSKGYTFNILLDETFSTSETYKIVAIPMTFLIDKSGIVSYMKFGKEDWTSPENIERVENLLK